MNTLSNNAPVSAMLNLGPKTEAWLNGVGIMTKQDLLAIGPVKAFQRISEAGFSSHLMLLYALAGAVMNINCMELPENLKRSLRQQVGK